MASSIWVGNLRDTRSLESDLSAICSRYGQVEDLWVSRAPTGPDCFAVVTFASLAAAQRAQLALAGQVLPALTEKMLKVREWTERPSQATTWRHDVPAAPQQRWADAEDELPLQPRRTFGSGWGAAGAASDDEEEGEEEEEYDEDEDEDDEEDDDWDPLVELWVGNLCGEATRVSLRRAFELFGEVANITLSRAPYDRNLQYAMVLLPASGAERALQELNGLIVYELSGDMELIVKQSKRSLKPLLRWQQEQQRRQAGAAQRAARAAAAPPVQRGPVDAEGLEVAREDGSVVPLQGPVRRLKKMFVCEGPPSRMLWVGSIGGHATPADVTSLFRRYGAVHSVKLQTAPGYQNTFQFALVRMGSPAEAERARSDLQGVDDEDICDSKPLKLRYGWPPRLVMRAGQLPAAAQQQQRGEEDERPPGFAGGSSSAAARPAAPCCAVCGAREPAAALKRCSACRAVHYCSTQCQLKGWEAGHHQECARLQQLGSVLDTPEQQLPVAAVRLLAAALRQPGRREGRMLQALLAQQQQQQEQQQQQQSSKAAAGARAAAEAAAGTAAAAGAAGTEAAQGSASS